MTVRWKGKPFCSYLWIVFALTVWFSEAKATIPLYAQDWGAKIVDWSTGTVMLPETADLILSHGLLYGENANLPGDAAFFQSNGGPGLIHYLGFTNLYFGGMPGYIDELGWGRSREGNYYHSTDPATLTAWRSASGVEIRWTWDLRYVMRQDYIQLNNPNPPGQINDYLVERINLDDPSRNKRRMTISGTTSFLDNTAHQDSTYSYTIKSLPASGDTLDFSARPDTVDTGIEVGPHFWAQKVDFQERAYQEHLIGNIDNNVSISYAIQFNVSEPINPGDCVLEIYREYESYPGVWDEVTGFSFDAQAGELTLELQTSTGFMTDHGGVVCRLKYAAPGGGVKYFPAEVGQRKQFVWSSINNRVMGKTWLSYMMNTEGDDWKSTYQYFCQQLADGVDPTGHGHYVVYDGVFMDSVLGLVSSTHNLIKPYEYGGSANYLETTATLIEAVSTTTGLDCYPNTTSLLLLERLESPGTITGYMDENLVMQDHGTTQLADALWGFRGHPQWQNIMMNRFDYAANLDERIQSLAAFLFVREPTIVSGSEKALFGYGGGGGGSPGDISGLGNVNILPEQMLNVGDALNDPFAGTVWPLAEDWKTNFHFPDTEFISWAASNSSGFIKTVNGRAFAVQEFSLNDGLPLEDNEVLVVWDLVESAPHTPFSIGDLFADKVGEGPFYRLEVMGEYPRLVDGGSLGTSEAIEYSDDVIFQEESAAIFFTAPVASPSVAEDGQLVLAGGPAGETVLSIEASHWNGQVLDELKADGTALGLSNEILLFDVDDDSTYVANIATPLARPISCEIPVIATGNDGLMRYTTVWIEVGDVVTRYVDRSEKADGTQRMLYSDMPYSSVTVDFDGQGPRDIAVSFLNARTRIYGAEDLAIDGGIPDYSEINGAFGAGDLPVNLLGLSIADIDNDGLEELFGASQVSPRLYSLSGGKFHDVGDDFGVNPEVLISTCGSWADYDLDGDVDLLVGTSDCAIFEPGYGYGWVQDVLLRNDLGTDGVFTDVSDSAGITSLYATNCTSVAWADVNSDGWPDAFIGEASEDNIGPPPVGSAAIDSRLWINQGDGTFVDEMSTRIGAHSTLYTASAVWRDMDCDGDIDLEIGTHSSRQGLENDGSGNFPNMDFSVSGGDFSGSKVFDHDLDGLEDILMLPKNETGKPILLARDLDVGGEVFFDYSGSSGIDQVGKIGGAVSADLNGDGDVDLFLGRKPEQLPEDSSPIGHQYLFQATASSSGSDAPDNNWFSVRVESLTGFNNRMGIGAKVSVYEDGIQTPSRVRFVDGGSGRGNQDDPTLIFGLGNATSVDSVAVDWPTGWRQVVPGPSLNISTGPGLPGDNLIQDSSTFFIPDNLVGARYQVIPYSDVVDWVFTWETRIRTDGSLDRVFCGECGSPTVELAPGAPNVEYETHILANGRQLHQLTWKNRPCTPRCIIEYQVRSRFQSEVRDSNYKIAKQKFCLAQ